jgi:hypothetical protein
MVLGDNYRYENFYNDWEKVLVLLSCTFFSDFFQPLIKDWLIKYIEK